MDAQAEHQTISKTGVRASSDTRSDEDQKPEIITIRVDDREGIEKKGFPDDGRYYWYFRSR